MENIGTENVPKQCNKQYRELLELLPDAVYIHHKDVVVFANSEGAKLLGARDTSEVVGKHIMDLVHPDFHNIVRKRINKLSKGEECIPALEEKFFRVDGTVVDVEVIAKAFLFEEQPGILVIARDITTRKIAEESLYRSRERCSQLIELLPDAVFIHGSGKIIFANSSAARLTGFNSCKELIGKNLVDFMPSGHKKIDGQFFKQIISRSREVPSHEGKIKRADGSLIDAEVTLTPMLYENQPAIMITMRDITQKKKAEQERSRIFDLSIDMMCISSFDGSFLELNPAWDNSLGFTRSELLSKPYIEFVHPEDRVRTLSATQSLCNGESVMLFQNRYLCKDGSCKWLSWNSLPVIEQGFIYSVVRDITEHKESEKMRRLLNETIQYDKIKTEFFANISHELRTPLNIILSTIQLMDLYMASDWEQNTAEQISRHIKVMKQNCYRLLKLINNLIDITRIDSGYLELRPQNHNIVSVVEDITLSVAGYSENRGIHLVFDTDTEEKIIAFDPDKIERIMLNLLSNAIKITRPGGSIKVNVFNKKDSVVISVKDTGAGIPEEKLGIIFERFRQADSLLTRSHEGSGIGLSLVKSLVEMHGGTISVNSKPGKGSEFLVELPAKIIPETYTKVNTDNHILQNQVERLNIEFSDIYSNDD